MPLLEVAAMCASLTLDECMAEMGRGKLRCDPDHCDPERGEDYLCASCAVVYDAEREDARRIWEGMKQAGLSGNAEADEQAMRDAGRIR